MPWKPGKPQGISGEQLKKFSDWVGQGVEEAKEALSGKNPIPKGFKPDAAKKMLEWIEGAKAAGRDASGSQEIRAQALKKWLPQIEENYVKFLAEQSASGALLLKGFAGVLGVLLGALVWVISSPKTIGVGRGESTEPGATASLTQRNVPSMSSSDRFQYDPSKLTPEEQADRLKNEKIVRDETLRGRQPAANGNCQGAQESVSSLALLAQQACRNDPLYSPQGRGFAPAPDCLAADNRAVAAFERYCSCLGMKEDPQPRDIGAFYPSITGGYPRRPNPRQPSATLCTEEGWIR